MFPRMVWWRYNKDKDNFTLPPHHSCPTTRVCLLTNSWKSKNVLKNVLQLTKVSFFASLRSKKEKHTHMGCFMKRGHNWLCLWSMKLKASINTTIPPISFLRAYKQEYKLSQRNINFSLMWIFIKIFIKALQLQQQTNFYSFTIFGS